jgi:DNA invertase Pin-like site-specific DNA recombinase
MRVALYLRRSTTDLQPDSLETQQEILERYAADHSHLIVRIFQDSASGRTIHGRDQFQELIDAVKGGTDFETVLVRDVTRWGRFENTDEAGFYEFISRSHGAAAERGRHINLGLAYSAQCIEDTIRAYDGSPRRPMPMV